MTFILNETPMPVDTVAARSIKFCNKGKTRFFGGFIFLLCVWFWQLGEAESHSCKQVCWSWSYLITLVNIFLCLLFIECCLANHLLPSNTIVHVTYFLKKKELVFGVLLVFTFISKLIALFQKCIINKREDTELPPTTLHHSLYMFGKLLNT